MGVVVSLVERAQEQFDEEEAKKLQRKLAKNQFDFNDFLAQIAQIKKMGNIKDLMAMIPGVGKAVKDLDIDDNAFKSVEAIIHSMTPYERANPDAINLSGRSARPSVCFHDSEPRVGLLPRLSLHLQGWNPINVYLFIYFSSKCLNVG